MTADLFEFSDLVALASDAIIVRRTDGEILFWNAGAERMYGWTAEQAVGRVSHELLGTRFAEPLPEINERLAGSKTWEGLLHHRTAAGDELVVASRWVHRADSAIVLEVNRDETGRYRAEQALRTERRQFEVLTSDLPVMVAHCDRDLRFVYVNRAYAERFGLAPSDLVGRKVTDIIGEDALLASARHVDQVLSGQSVAYETWATYPRLGPRYIRCHFSPQIDATGRTVGFIAGLLDDTDHKNAEDTLRATRARFDFVSTSADIGVWSGDVPLDTLIWNAACKAHFGLPPDAPVTIDTFFERMHPDDVDATRAAMAAALRDGIPYDVEYRTRQQDDSFRWIRALGRAEFGPDGAARRFDGITIDVSNTRQANERFREAADAMPQIIWAADAHGRVDYLNRRWYELTGKPAGSLEFEDVLHPDDRDAVLGAFQRSVDTGEPFEHAYRLQLPAFASPRWFLGRALPVRDAAGAVTRWYATSTDIDDHKHTETALVDSRDRLRAALDASRTGTFRWDIDSNVLDWDDNLDALFGLAPGATARSLPEFVRLVHPDDRERVIASCARCAAQNVDFVEEFRVVWPDGSVRWLFDRGRVITGGDGRRYMIGACHDVTERRLKEEALKEADRQKDEFLGMLAHEIRNPLAPIMYSASILERRVQDPTLRRPLDIIHRQATRMIRIVDDLLDVSRVTQGKISLKRDRVAVAALLRQSAEALRPTMEARHHTLTLHDVNPSLVVQGDAVRLAQVIENLLINAAKYTPNGGRIDLSAEARGDRVAIVVGDTGIGIAPDMVSRVFDLFAQADTSLDRAEGGLGIGLTLVDRLTRLHGGSVSVASAGPGHGSTFTVTLPLLMADATEDTPASDSDGSEAPRRVLVVDDNRDSAEMLRSLITMGGHTVRLAHEGTEAVRVATEFEPDVVLLDIGLPGKDGYHVIKDLRAIPALAGALIVAATGYGSIEDRARCLASGFDDHATKPIDPQQLKRILRAETTRQ